MYRDFYSFDAHKFLGARRRVRLHRQSSSFAAPRLEIPDVIPEVGEAFEGSPVDVPDEAVNELVEHPEQVEELTGFADRLYKAVCGGSGPPSPPGRIGNARNYIYDKYKQNAPRGVQYIASSLKNSAAKMKVFKLTIP